MESSKTNLFYQQQIQDKQNNRSYKTNDKKGEIDMKKIILVSLVLLVAFVLIAATPAPVQKVAGTLQYSRGNVCNMPDYITLPVMQNLYLKGFMFPTSGQYANCRIVAEGHYELSTGTSPQCRVFDVTRASLVCPRQDSADLR